MACNRILKYRITDLNNLTAGHPEEYGVFRTTLFLIMWLILLLWIFSAVFIGLENGEDGQICQEYTNKNDNTLLK
jgi:hypothetical protein